MDKHLNQFLKIEYLSPFLNLRNKIKKNSYSNTHQTLFKSLYKNNMKKDEFDLKWVFNAKNM